MKQYCLYIIIVCILQSCTSCEEQFIDIYVVNNSCDTITTLSKFHPNYVGNRDTILYPLLQLDKDTIREWAWPRGWSFANACQFYDGHYDFDTISVFILSYTTYRSKSWEQIAEDYDILARYDITNENVASRVEGNSGKIILPYPPNEEISDIYTYVP